MAKNRILDLKKKQIIEQQHLKDYSTSIPSHSSPNDELEFHELNRNTQRAIEALPERQKCIFKLAVLQDYNRVQISENLQLSLAVVDKQLYLATKSIRKYILQKT